MEFSLARRERVGVRENCSDENTGPIQDEVGKFSTEGAHSAASTLQRFNFNARQTFDAFGKDDRLTIFMSLPS